MPFFKHLDEHADITDLLFADRKRLGHTDKLTQAVMRGKSPFSEAERELMAAYVSGLNACQYCHGIHSAVARNFGVEAKLIDALLEDIDSSPVPERLKPVFQYLKKLTLSPSQVMQADVDAVLAANWTEEAVYHAILVCSLFNFYNRLLDGHGIKGRAFIYEYGGEHLHKRGYLFPRFLDLMKKRLRKNKLKKMAEIEGTPDPVQRH
ncbi:MAG: carboxymuconolactone decarboxylase family protein [Bacteroidota bacterium]